MPVVPRSPFLESYGALRQRKPLLESSSAPRRSMTTEEWEWVKDLLQGIVSKESLMVQPTGLPGGSYFPSQLIEYSGDPRSADVFQHEAGHALDPWLTQFKRLPVRELSHRREVEGKSFIDPYEYGGPGALQAYRRLGVPAPNFGKEQRAQIAGDWLAGQKTPAHTYYVQQMQEEAIRRKFPTDPSIEAVAFWKAAFRRILSGGR